MNKRKVSLLVKTLENVIESLKLELGEEEEQPQNSIKITDLIEKSLSDDGINYYEEDSGPDVLLNSKEEQEFYSKFKLGE
jgi:hypothetical protein